MTGRGPGYKQPGNWKSTVGRILARDQHTCHLCPEPAVSVDHLVSVAEALAAGLEPDHSDANLAAICATHKAIKDEQDRLAGLARRQARRRNAMRTVEAHPNQA